MKKTAFPLILASLATASAVSAEGVNYLSYGASYSNMSSGGTSLNAFGAGASTDYQSGNLVFNGGVSFTKLSDDTDSFELTAVDARVGYFVMPQLAVYAGLSYFDVSDFDSLTTYNLGAEYSMNGATVGLNYDDSEEDGYLATTTVYGSYRVGETVEAMAAISDTDGYRSTTIGVDYDNGAYDLAAMANFTDDANLFALDAKYAFGNGFRVSGNYINLDHGVDMSFIGAGYEVSPDLWVDLNVGRLNSTGASSVELIGLALTYEMGSETMLVDRATKTQVDALGPLGQIVMAF